MSKAPKLYHCLKCDHWTRTKDGKPPKRCGSCGRWDWRNPRTKPRKEATHAA